MFIFLHCNEKTLDVSKKQKCVSFILYISYNVYKYINQNILWGKIMGRKSTKENKTIYQTSREAMEYTREAAAEKLGFISTDRIEKIENEKSLPHPEEVLAMADCYKNPSLCNYFCAHECPIGIEYVPEIKAKNLSQITLEMLATLNKLTHEKERLIEITVDGELSEDELPDFFKIKDQLEKMALAIDSLNLWLDQTIAAGKLNKEQINTNKNNKT